MSTSTDVQKTQTTNQRFKFSQPSNFNSNSEDIKKELRKGLQGVQILNNYINLKDQTRTNIQKVVKILRQIQIEIDVTKDIDIQYGNLEELRYVANSCLKSILPKNSSVKQTELKIIKIAKESQTEEVDNNNSIMPFTKNPRPG